MPASPPPADDSEELDEDDVFAEDVLPALEPVELPVLVATTAVAAATAAAAVGSRRFGFILLDIGLVLAVLSSICIACSSSNFMTSQGDAIK